MIATPSTCPVCRAAVAPGLAACDDCGLVFASYGSAPAAAPPAATAAPSAVLSPLSPGQRLDEGRYVVDRALSRGGQGALYLAHDSRAFGRKVVIKTLIAYFDAADPAEAQAARDRFLAEARTLASVKYPTFPQIFAYFQDGPHACIVMEYVDGDDLTGGLTLTGDDGSTRPGRAYPAEQVARWGVDLCAMLEYLGERRPPVIHRDIKPANLVLDRHSRELFLVDFGTARSGKRTGRLQGDDGAFGTPGYAPPEQYKGRSTPKSDVYALAATLYHLATDDDPGAHPFDFPRLSALGPLGAALAPALERDPARRCGAAELRAALAPLGGAAAAPLGRLALTPPSGDLSAPDGGRLKGWPELRVWCERNWDAAAGWLQGDLPLALRQEWRAGRAADEIERLVAAHAGNPDAALDAVLAAIDPGGFGTGSAEVRAPAELSLGHVTGGGRRGLRVENSGRRYGLLRVSAVPPWRARPPELSLPPGGGAFVEVQLDAAAISAGLRSPGAGPAAQEVQGSLQITAPGGSTAAVRLSAVVHSTRWTTPLAIGAVTGLIVLLILAGLAAGRAVATGPAPTPGPVPTPTAPIFSSGVAGSVVRVDLGQPLLGLAVRPDGRLLLAHDGGVTAVNPVDRSRVEAAQIGGDVVISVSQNDTSDVLMAGGTRGQVYVMQGGQVRPRWRMRIDGAGSNVVAVAAGEYGPVVAAADSDGVVSVWVEDEHVRDFELGAPVTQLAVDFMDVIVASGGQILRLDMLGEPTATLFDDGSADVVSFRVLPGGERLAAAVDLEGGTLRLYRDSEMLWEQRLGGLGRQLPAIAPNGAHVAVGWGSQLLILDGADGAPVGQAAVGGQLAPLAFSPDGRRLHVADGNALLTIELMP